jgi:hypothetical protein
MLTGAVVFCHAQWLNYPTPGIPCLLDGKPNLSEPTPKTSDGKPDLSGIWGLTNIEGGLRQLKASEINPWALKLFKEREEGLGKDSPGVQCLPDGAPAGKPRENCPYPGADRHVARGAAYRQIFLDGRELPKDPNPTWMGYSVGRWEGDTLVVESTGYNERTWLDSGYPHTENMHLTERFHRGDFGHLTVDAQYSDPAAHGKPWTVKTGWRYFADTDLLEYVCNENEKDRAHLNAGASRGK